MMVAVPAIDEEQKIMVSSIGVMAARSLCQSSRWRLLSAYKRSFYCIDHKNNIICIGLDKIEKGPFTLLCSLGEKWSRERLESVKYFNVDGNRLISKRAGLCFDLKSSVIWQDSLHDLNSHEDFIEEDLSWLVHQASLSAPEESFGFLIPALFSGDGNKVVEMQNGICSLLHKKVITVIDSLRDDYRLPAESFNIMDCVSGLQSLIGLGHGLTPSGDDFLAGVVMGFHKMHKHKEASLLARGFYAKAQGKTTVISLAFYRALADGLIAEPHMQFLEILGKQEKVNRERIFDRVIHFGGTSGWDTLAGIVFGISLIKQSLGKSKKSLSEAVC
jgi:hypothetical protein